MSAGMSTGFGTGAIHEHRGRGRPVVAIIGGGFSGAATAFHLARALPSGDADIIVVEPRPILGRGLAYGTENPVHRVNVPAAKMSLVGDRLEHFQNWLTTERVSMSPGTLSRRGDHFPERRIFGQYVAAQLAPLLAAGVIRHKRGSATAARSLGARFRIALSDETELEADVIVLAITHPDPAIPWALRGLVGSDRLIASPYDNARIAAIDPRDRILVVGAGLTSADVIATLDAQGARGCVTALSRHGLRPRGHGARARSGADFARTPERTAIGLLRRIRAAVAADAADGASWHATLDRAREQGDAIWRALPAAERGRVVRHLRPFWDAHRFRIAPQVETVLKAREARGLLDHVAGRIVEAHAEAGGIAVRYRPRGGTRGVAERFDTVIVTTGPDHAHVVETDPLLRSLAAEGLLEADPLGLGIRVSGRCRAVAQDGTASETVFVAGPLARGDVGELMGVPEVARHAERLAGLIAQRLTSPMTPTAETTLSRRGARPKPWSR